jgi:hypothetical protein
MPNRVSASVSGFDFAALSPALAFSLSFFSASSGKAGLMTSSAHQGERELEVLLEHLGVHAGVVGPGAGAEAAADELDLLVDLGLGAGLGALASICAVIWASCSSSIVPARMTSWALTSGTSWFSTT